MTECSHDPVKLIEVRSEPQAQLIVAALEDEGIQAQVEGGLIASFRAEVPGTVAVLVHRSDLDRAREVLRNLKLT